MTLKKKLIVAAAAAAIVLVVILAFGAYMKHRLDAETRVMKPLPSSHLNPDIYVVRDGFVNFYLVKDGETFVAIDAGNDAAGVGKKMALMHLDPQKVTAVFLTHTDRDHVAALGWCRANGFSGRVLMTAETAAETDATLAAYATAQERVLGRQLQPEIIAPGQAFSLGPIAVRTIIGKATPLYTDEDGNGRFVWRAATH